MNKMTNVSKIVIITDRKAPVNVNKRSGTSKWKDLFESMQVNDWILIQDRKTLANIQRAATIYLRGRYRCYMNPEIECTWVFTKYK
jgi:hypothetical protein